VIPKPGVVVANPANPLPPINEMCKVITMAADIGKNVYDDVRRQDKHNDFAKWTANSFDIISAMGKVCSSAAGGGPKSTADVCDGIATLSDLVAISADNAGDGNVANVFDSLSNMFAICKSAADVTGIANLSRGDKLKKAKALCDEVSLNGSSEQLRCNLLEVAQDKCNSYVKSTNRAVSTIANACGKLSEMSQ